MVSHQHSDLLRFVNDELMAQPGVPEALKVMGIEQATPALELTAFITGGTPLHSHWSLGRFLDPRPRSSRRQ